MGFWGANEEEGTLGSFSSSSAPEGFSYHLKDTIAVITIWFVFVQFPHELGIVLASLYLGYRLLRHWDNSKPESLYKSASAGKAARYRSNDDEVSVASLRSFQSLPAVKKRRSRTLRRKMSEKQDPELQAKLSFENQNVERLKKSNAETNARLEETNARLEAEKQKVKNLEAKLEDGLLTRGMHDMRTALEVERKNLDFLTKSHESTVQRLEAEQEKVKKLEAERTSLTEHYNYKELLAAEQQKVKTMVDIVQLLEEQGDERMQDGDMTNAQHTRMRLIKCQKLLGIEREKTSTLEFQLNGMNEMVNAKSEEILSLSQTLEQSEASLLANEATFKELSKSHEELKVVVDGEHRKFQDMDRLRHEAVAAMQIERETTRELLEQQAKSNELLEQSKQMIQVKDSHLEAAEKSMLLLKQEHERLQVQTKNQQSNLAQQLDAERARNRHLQETLEEQKTNLNHLWKAENDTVQEVKQALMEKDSLLARAEAEISLLNEKQANLTNLLNSEKSNVYGLEESLEAKLRTLSAEKEKNDSLHLDSETARKKWLHKEEELNSKITWEETKVKKLETVLREKESSLSQAEARVAGLEKEKEMMMVKMEEQQKVIQSQKDVQDNLTDRLSSEREKISDLELKKADVEAKLRKQQQKELELNAAHTSEQNKATFSETELKAKEKELAIANENLKALEIEYDEAQLKLDGWSQRTVQLEAEKRKLDTLYTSAKEKLKLEEKNSKEQREEQNRRNISQQQTISALEATIEEKSMELLDIKESLTKMQNDQLEMENKFKKEQEEVLNLKEEKSELKSDRTKTQSDLRKHQLELKELQSQLEIEKDNIKSLNEVEMKLRQKLDTEELKTVSLEEQQAAITNELERERKQVKKLEFEIEKQEILLSAEKEKVAELQTKLKYNQSDLREMLEAAELRCVELEKLLEDTQRTLNDEKQRVAELEEDQENQKSKWESKLEEAKVLREEATQQIQEAETAKSTLTKALAVYTDKLQALEEEQADKKMLLESKENRLKELKKRLETEKQAVEVLSKSKTELESTLQKTDEIKEELEGSFQVMKREVMALALRVKQRDLVLSTMLSGIGRSKFFGINKRVSQFVSEMEKKTGLTIVHPTKQEIIREKALALSTKALVLSSNARHLGHQLALTGHQLALTGHQQLAWALPLISSSVPAKLREPVLVMLGYKS